MKKAIISVAILFGITIFSADFALATNGADCAARGGTCDKACLSKPSIGGYDCPSGWLCCGDSATAQQKALEPGGLNPMSGSAVNTQTTSFNSPLGQNMGTVDKVIVSLQSYLNAVAGTIALVFILIGAGLYIAAAFGKVTLAELGKKIVIVAVGGFVVVVAAPVFWKEIQNVVQGNPETVVKYSGMSKIINGILPSFITLIGLYAIISFLIGAITMLVAAGDEKRYERGKTILKFALIGTVIAFGAVVITRQIMQLLGG